MAKQAQFTSNKTVFNKTLDFPEASGVYKFLNSKGQNHNPILVQSVCLVLDNHLVVYGFKSIYKKK